MLMLMAGLIACSPARETISCVGGLGGSTSNFTPVPSHLESFHQKEFSFLPAHTLPKEKRHLCGPLGFAIARTCNRKPMSFSVIDHGFGARLFVEFLHDSRTSGKHSSRNSNKLQMENYLME